MTDIQHNTKRWQKKTNRHTTTAGRSWGWIEGAPGNICWSDDLGSNLTSTQACKLVNEHNLWLEEQKPIVLRIVEATERVTTARKSYEQAQQEANRRMDVLEGALHELAALEGKP